MKEDKAYLSVSRRYLQSCESHLANSSKLQEVIGFDAYHAFESIGGAFNAHYGHSVPKSHTNKINSFVSNSRHNPQLNPHIVAAVAMIVGAMRNKFLYPYRKGTGFAIPEDHLSMTDATRMVQRVRGIIRKIERII